MPRTTQIFCASTPYGAATLAAAIDAGRFSPAGRRLLLISNNAVNPETTPSVDDAPGFAAVRTRFDEVLSWNETVSPFHPSGWRPRLNDVPLWERHLRALWRLGDDRVELALESVQVAPALALAQVFTDAPVDVYADGLISYGPTRGKLDPLVGTRVRRLLHLDLVPGLRPLLLTEFGVPAELVPDEALVKVMREMSEAGAVSAGLPETGDNPVVLLGQYLSALDILTAEQEEDLHREMVRGAVALGHTRLVFKPHPVAPARWSRLLEEEAARLGAELVVASSPVPAEVLYERLRPALVVGCFSTALLTASVLYGIPVARVGTDTLLDRLAPYQNSNRVPVTIVDALLPCLADRDRVAAQEPGMPVEELGDLLRAVGFAMQARIYPELRPAAERYLSTRLNDDTWRYFKRRRLTALALPGAVPSQLAFIPRNATVRRIARRARALRPAARR